MSSSQSEKVQPKPIINLPDVENHHQPSRTSSPSTHDHSDSRSNSPFSVYDIDGGVYHCGSSSDSEISSPLTFARYDTADPIDNEAGRFPHYRNRASLPLAIPGGATSSAAIDVPDPDGEERMDSSPQRELRRQSRSLDSELRQNLNANGSGPSSEPGSKGEWAALAHHLDNVGMDFSYITTLRSSSDSHSFVDRGGRQVDNSSVTVQSPVGDTFMNHVGTCDPRYNHERAHWIFAREKPDTPAPPTQAQVEIAPWEAVDQNKSLSVPKRTIRNANAKRKPKSKSSDTGMAVGTSEMWKFSAVGRFKVDRISFNSKPSSSTPHHRLHIRHVIDSHGTRGVPSIVIHRHSRVAAFSIMRGHNLGRQTVMRPGILLGPKTVQEGFYKTKTTSRLATHGLLEGNEGDPSNSQDASTRAEAKAKKQSGDKKTKRGHDKDTAVETSGTTSITPWIDITSLPSVVPANPSPIVDLRKPPFSSESVESVVSAGTTSNEEARSISDQSTTSLHAYERPFRRGGSTAYNRYAEAYGVRDIEIARAKPIPSMTVLDDPNSSFIKRLLHPHHPKAANGKPAFVGGNYKPPWMEISPRTRQDQVEEVNAMLKDAFKELGLLPLQSPPKIKKTRRTNNENGTVLDGIPDVLYMLLPMWPGEADPYFIDEKEPKYEAPAVENRMYLLVFYIKKERPYVERIELQIDARMVSYNELRGSGVRLPVEGLAVTGSMYDAMRSVPDPVTSQSTVIIGAYRGRNSGIEFDATGMQTLGLTRPQRQSINSLAEAQELKLNPLGKAVVEMTWAGCLALYSFGKA